MKKIAKDAFALFMITLVAGVLLAAVYAVTKEPIARAALEARAKAYRGIFAQAASFAEDDAVNEALKNADEALSKAGFAGCKVADALYATDANGEKIGYVLTVSGSGYGGPIDLTLGIGTDGKLTGISILSHTETAGLGSKCTDESFYGQFAGKSATALSVVKGRANETQIDSISGATVTSQGVTNAVNAGIWFVSEYMQVGGGLDA